MIRRDAGDRWLLVRQPDHARLSGELAALWTEGGRLSPRAVRGIAEHDAGWIDWEAAPKADPRTGRPIAFNEAALEDHLAIWRRGPAVVAREDAYAGLLVSHHGTGLLQMKLRLSPSLSSDERAAIGGYLEEQEAFRARVAREAGLALDPALVRRDVAVLRLLDYLSLVLCCRPAESGPLDIDGLRLEVTALAERAVALAPWPFGEPRSFGLSVPAAPLATRRHDDASLAAALAAAPREPLDFRFEPAV